MLSNTHDTYDTVTYDTYAYAHGFCHDTYDT